MIYLDNSATTRTFDSAAEAARNYMLRDYFNPSSAYSPAVAVEKSVLLAKKRLASVIKASPDEIIFTSGATESNNMAFSGALRAMRGKGRIIVSAVEHPSVYETALTYKSAGYDVVFAEVDGNGRVRLDSFSQLVTQNTQFVSVMQVNNETGAINQIFEINDRLKSIAPGAIMHIDGVQGFLRVPISAEACDMYSLSGHKFHAPKGVGALYASKRIKFLGGQTGGGQENGLRSGTINTPGILAMDAAIQQYVSNNDTYVNSMMRCKLRLAENLLRIRDTVINGPAPLDSAPHILNVSFMGVRGEVLLHALEERQIYVATGSACSSYKHGKNRILESMGVKGERQEGAIRFSLCPFNTIAEMDEAATAIESMAAFLRRYRRR
ncbi:MAG: cysteine desulfurase family protein [Candidatus Gastranaerophilaceae bacterium]|nr:cysteine desulfurase family protein [Christensenellales bacterium]